MLDEGKKSVGRKVLLVNDHIHFGGGGDANLWHAHAVLREAGHDVYTFSHAEERPAGLGANDRVHLESSSRVRRKLGKFGFSRGALDAFKRALAEIRPDLVHLHLVSKYPGAVYSALADYKVVQTLHGPNLFCSTSWGSLRTTGADCEMGIGLKCATRGCVSWGRLPAHLAYRAQIDRWAKPNVDLFLCPSRQLLKSVQALGFQPARYFPYCVDHQFVTPGAPEPAPQPTVLFVGALVEQKGVVPMIDAFARVVAALPGARLKIAGRGPLRGEMERRVSAHGLEDNVEFLGFVAHDQAHEHYRRAHMLVVPSIWKEQFGLVGPEALACQVPCVATEVGGIPEWLRDSEWGYLVPPRSVEPLAEAMIALLSDEARRRAFGAAGRQFVMEHFHPDLYKRNLLELVEELTA